MGVVPASDSPTRRLRTRWRTAVAAVIVAPITRAARLRAGARQRPTCTTPAVGTRASAVV